MEGRSHPFPFSALVFPDPNDGYSFTAGLIDFFYSHRLAKQQFEPATFYTIYGCLNQATYLEKGGKNEIAVFPPL